MQDERSMILNMLKEGKISVAEAEALLEVLDEGVSDDPGGFTPKADRQTQASRQSPGETPHGETPPGEAPPGETPPRGGPAGDAPSGGSQARPGEKTGAFSLDLDFSGLKESLREAMSGVSEAVKGVMGELSDLDLGPEIFRAMGKIRADSAEVVTVFAGDASGLSISNKWGDIRVTGKRTEDEAGQITVRAKASAWGRSQGEADAALGTLAVRLEQVGDTWHVRSGLEGETAGRVRIDYEITVPRHMDLSASSVSGDIWVEELEGSQSVTTLSGDITMADLGTPGSIQVMKSKSGDIVGGALTGDVSLSSLSGDIEISGFSGNLKVATQSGDVSVRSGSGSMQVKTMSGEVKAALVALGEQPVIVTTVSGDVELRIPGDSAVDLRAKSASGDVAVDLDLVTEKESEHAVVGTRHGGGVEVTVTAVSGDISVSET